VPTAPEAATLNTDWFVDMSMENPARSPTLAPGSGYAFHRTSPANVASIREHGIRRDRERGTDSAMILDVLEEFGGAQPLPFDRRSVVYLHVDPEAVRESLEGTVDEGGLNTDAAHVVVDVTKVDAPVYVANMSVVTDLLDYGYGAGDQMLHGETPEAVVEAYRDSVTRVETPAELTALVLPDAGAWELVVDGDVPPTAIVDVLERRSGPQQ
jgi:hypothetical protein